MMKKLTLCLMMLCLGVLAFAQTTMTDNSIGDVQNESFDKWEIGGFLGGSYYQGDVQCRTFEGLGVIPQTYLALGLDVKRYLTPNLDLRLNFFRGTIAGKEIDFEDRGHAARGFEFTSPITEFSAMLEYDLLGGKRWRDNAFTKTFSPYIFGGIGVALNNPEIDWNLSNQNAARIAKIDEDKADIKTTALAIPVGIGVKYNLSRKFVIGLEAGGRWTFSDYLDGFSQSANPEKNDWYALGGLTLGYKLGQMQDTDGDGIADKVDACPLVYGLEAFAGCPDTDGDGIQDKMDNCPKVAGIVAFGGCPDSDGDGIMDKEDNCPNTPGTVKGCPDSDMDGVIDSKDKCPSVKGSATTAGCPDSDGDGLADANDNCPNVAGPKNYGGCPDTDGDGVIDNLDKCPTVKGASDNDGCPNVDSDNDGIIDRLDKCPTVFGIAANSGCPEVKKVMTNKLSKKVYYSTSSSIIRAAESVKVKEVSTFMKANTNYIVRLTGYADHRGTVENNQKLSDSRAEAVKQMLIKNGIDVSRITYVGLGEVDSDGKTAAELQEYRSTLLEVVGY